MKMDEIVQEKIRDAFADKSIVFDKSHFAGGLTNYNYIMSIKGDEYVIRKPGGMTEAIIDRRVEQVNNSIASAAGVNSKCIFFDAESGVKISRYISDSLNLAQADPASASSLKAAATLMKRVHSFADGFANVFDWQVELDKYERIIGQLNGEVFFDYAELKERLIAFVQENIKSTSLTPCHNDTVPENFIIDAQGSTYLIDWEYSGMNDPCWDVAAYMLEARLAPEAIECLLRSYFERLPDAVEEMKLKCFILAQDLLWSAWALIRHYNGDDFLEYCCIRYERFRKNLQLLAVERDCPIGKLVIG